MPSKDSESGIPAVELATLTEQGDREDQCDGALGIANPDGSWVVAVVDGTGGGRRPEEAAPAALSALPSRIASESEMSSALAAASNAVRRLTIDESIYPADEDLPPYWGIEMEAAMVVASWTPEGGLIVAWIGDSIPFLLPAAGGRCWAGEPMGMSGALVAGDFAITPTGLPSQSLADSTRWLSASIPRGEVDGIIRSEGLVVALLSDGAHNAWTEDCPCLDEDDQVGLPEGRSGGAGTESLCGEPWHCPDPAGGPDTCLLLPAEALASAKAAAEAVMDRARRSGLDDNTTVAAARIPSVQ